MARIWVRVSYPNFRMFCNWRCCVCGVRTIVRSSEDFRTVSRANLTHFSIANRTFERFFQKIETRTGVRTSRTVGLSLVPITDFAS